MSTAAIHHGGLPAPFTAEGRRFGPGLVVALGGELDLATTAAADAALRHAGRHANLVVLDLRDLSFMDCPTGLRMVIAADARLRTTGGRLVVVHGPPAVRRGFELTAAAERLEMVCDPAAALAAAAKAPPAQRALEIESEVAEPEPGRVDHRPGRLETLPYAAGSGQVQVIAVEGVPDAGTVAQLEQAVTAALDHGDRHIVVDLIAVTGMTTATLSTLCATLRRLRHRHATLAVVGAQPHVRRVLELVELENLDLAATVRAALARIDNPTPPNGGPPSPPSPRRRAANPDQA